MNSRCAQWEAATHKHARTGTRKEIIKRMSSRWVFCRALLFLADPEKDQREMSWMWLFCSREREGEEPVLDMVPCCAQDLAESLLRSLLGKGEECRDTTVPRVEITSWCDCYLKFGSGNKKPGWK